MTRIFKFSFPNVGSTFRLLKIEDIEKICPLIQENDILVLVQQWYDQFYFYPSLQKYDYADDFQIDCPIPISDKIPPIFWVPLLQEFKNIKFNHNIQVKNKSSIRIGKHKYKILDLSKSCPENGFIFDGKKLVLI